MIKAINESNEYLIFWERDNKPTGASSTIQWLGTYIRHPKKNIILLDFVNVHSKKTYQMSNVYFIDTSMIAVTEIHPDDSDFVIAK
tara:strand:+ start:2764 stop:3021 length:258 start_codon:yes stop_codon:yes gene_type:complete